MLSYVCDRCRKIIPVNDQNKIFRLIVRDSPNKDKDIDLCSVCFNVFNMFMSRDESDDDPVEMPIDKDGFKCPRCHSHYAFGVTDEERHIHVLRIGSTTVEEGYIDRPFVNFNCTVCNHLLAIPKTILEEVNK